MTAANAPASLAEIVENFEFLDDWDDRYRYLIELGRTLAPMPDVAHNETNRVRGCASQVWLETHVDRDDRGAPHLTFLGDSDAHIVRGLVAIVLATYSGKRASDIAGLDALDVFGKIGLVEHLSSQRANGLRSMVRRIREEAAGKVAA